MLGDDDGGILRDVAGCLGGALFKNEATEATKVYILFTTEGILYAVHK